MLVPECKSLLLIPYKDKSIGIVYTNGLVRKIKEGKEFIHTAFFMPYRATNAHYPREGDNLLFRDEDWNKRSTTITIKFDGDYIVFIADTEQYSLLLTKLYLQ